MQSRRLLLFVVLYLVPLSGVGTDLYAPSLPAIAAELGAHVSQVKFTLAIYLLGFSVGQFLFGSLSDIYGRKPILIITLSLFCIASFTATQIHNIYILLLIRLLQGLSGAGPSATSKAILTDTLSGTELKKASIYLITVWGLSPIIAPAIGGYFQHYFGWRSNFYFFTAYSFSMLAAVIFLLQETNFNRHEPKWKNVFNNYLTLITHQFFLSNSSCIGLSFAMLMIFNIFTPFLVNNVLGFSSITFGHLAMLIGIGFLAGSFCNRWLMLHFSTRFINRVSMSLTMLTAIITVLIAYTIKMNLVTLTAPVFVMSFVGGLLQTNFMTHNLSLFPKMGGTASSAIGGLVSLIAGLVTASGSLVHHSTNQISVSWIYFIVNFIFVALYAFVLDKGQESEANQLPQKT